MTTTPQRALALCLATFSLLAAGHASAQTDAQVVTSSGPVVGQVIADVAAFRGIPYATPPVGDLRWREPRPAPRWSTPRGSHNGPACPQPRGPSLEGGGDVGPVDEDCLTLNVFAPAPVATGEHRPVMVWLHGGALVLGSGALPIYDGAALARRGVVVVSVNYRLGHLGVFAHPALERAAPGGPVNFGLLDQIAALEWVRDNIAAFGGDAQNVTVFGESAGAESVLALFVSPKARGLFQRGIAQSPYGIPSHPRAKAREVGIAVASAVGLDGASASLADLRAVPADRFIGVKGAGTSLAPALVVGDAALPAAILSTFQRGGEAALPLVVGSNSDEASIAIAFGIEPAALVRKLGAARIAIRPLYPAVKDDAQLGREVVRDVVFTAFARRIAYLHSTRAPTWRYYFSRVPTNQRATLAGVPHGGEIAAVFGADDACLCLPAQASDDDRAYAKRVGDLWTAFARGAIPEAPDTPPWPRDGRGAARTMEFGDEIVVRETFMKRRLNAFIGALNLIGPRSGE